MTVIQNFFDLDRLDKFLILKTFFYSYLVRLLVWGLPFSYVLKISASMGKIEVIIIPANIQKIIWAINCTDNLVLKSTCLTKAITAQILLSQHNYLSIVKIGVLKNTNFEAHAWVEVDGQIILGKSEKQFVSIVDL